MTDPTERPAERGHRHQWHKQNIGDGICCNPGENQNCHVLTADHANGLEQRLATAEEPVKDTYACHRCGRRDGLDTAVSHEHWQMLRQWAGFSDDRDGLLCLWCMDEGAVALGIQMPAKFYFVGNGARGNTTEAWTGILSELYDSDYKATYEEVKQQLIEAQSDRNAAILDATAAHQEAGGLRAQVAALVDALQTQAKQRHLREKHEVPYWAYADPPRDWQSCEAVNCKEVRDLLANLAPQAAQASARVRAMETALKPLAEFGGEKWPYEYPADKPIMAFNDWQLTWADVLAARKALADGAQDAPARE